MKKILISLSLVVSSAYLLNAQIVKSYEKPTKKEFKTAVKQVMNSTTCFGSDTTARLDAVNVIQREFNNFSQADWKSFCNCWDWVKVDDLELNGTLYYYRQAFNKVRREVRATKVAEGTVVLWNVYNMGYVVKTPTQTFGIDIVHKHIEELAPLLDFMLVTHKHGDHNDAHARNQLARAEVKVIAGFKLDKPVVWQGKLLDLEYVEEYDSIQIGDITINCKRVDHNATAAGHKFVTTYEIDCGPKTGNTVIFHSGDAYNHEELEVAKRPDIFIFHMSVGLKIQNALDKIQPNYAIFSHAWELGHKVEKWRWTIDDVLKRVHAIKGHDRLHLLYPCWGDKMVYTKSTGELSSK